MSANNSQEFQKTGRQDKIFLEIKKKHKRYLENYVSNRFFFLWQIVACGRGRQERNFPPKVENEENGWMRMIDPKVLGKCCCLCA